MHVQRTWRYDKMLFAYLIIKPTFTHTFHHYDKRKNNAQKILCASCTIPFHSRLMFKARTVADATVMTKLLLSVYLCVCVYLVLLLFVSNSVIALKNAVECIWFVRQEYTHPFQIYDIVIDVCMHEMNQWRKFKPAQICYSAKKK